MQKIDKKTILIGIAAIFGVVSIYFISAVAIPKALVTLTKAAPATKVSIKDSYVMGEVILAKADGKDKNKVNVFVMDANSRGVQGKTVAIQSEGLVIEKDMKTTDVDGKASFEMVSEKEGQFEVSASVEGVELARKIKVTFRN